MVIVPPANSPQLICTHRRAAGEHLDAVDHAGSRGTVLKATAIWPLASAVAVKLSWIALSLPPAVAIDVEIRQHLRAVDAHVELPLTGRRSTVGSAKSRATV